MIYGIISIVLMVACIVGAHHWGYSIGKAHGYKLGRMQGMEDAAMTARKVFSIN